MQESTLNTPLLKDQKEQKDYGASDTEVVIEMSPLRDLKDFLPSTSIRPTGKSTTALLQMIGEYATPIPEDKEGRILLYDINDQKTSIPIPKNDAKLKQPNFIAIIPQGQEFNIDKVIAGQEGALQTSTPAVQRAVKEMGACVSVSEIQKMELAAKPPKFTGDTLRETTAAFSALAALGSMDYLYVKLVQYGQDKSDNGDHLGTIAMIGGIVLILINTGISVSIICEKTGTGCHMEGHEGIKALLNFVALPTHIGYAIGDTLGSAAVSGANRIYSYFSGGRSSFFQTEEDAAKAALEKDRNSKGVKDIDRIGLDLMKQIDASVVPFVDNPPTLSS